LTNFSTILPKRKPRSPKRLGFFFSLLLHLLFIEYLRSYTST
jgi:hypothetical protein